MLEIADRITVLRRGKSMGTVPRAGATEQSLARMVVGRDVIFRVDKGDALPGGAILEVQDLHVQDDRDLEAVRGATFKVRSGEIVALAGVDGNGQTELVQAITGIRPPSSGTIEVDGIDITRRGVRAATAAGVAHIAEDRHRVGLVLPFTLAENLGLRGYRKPPLSKRGWLDLRAFVSLARRLIGAFDVRGGEPETPASALSGGNQQKLCIAREIDTDPKLLVAHQPTRGLDVGATEFIHGQLIEQRDAGNAVLLVSLESEEIRSLADRILVIYEGRIVAEFPPDATEEELGFAMTGAYRGTSMSLQAGLSRAGRAVVIPLTTVVLAFIAAGLVMILTGTDPLGTYGAIFNGTGLNWLFPWVGGHARVTAAEDLQQTLVATAPLILTGLSVAFAFRVGLFNIGAQGQYTVGAIVVVWVATSWNGLNPVLHIIISIGLAALISAFWAAIAGWLKAAVGTHEVISTIMLNWIAIYVAQYLFQEGGPLQGKQALGNPVSNTIAANMHLPVFWGNPQLQGLDVGIFISLFAAVVFWAIMHRSTLGYEVARRRPQPNRGPGGRDQRRPQLHRDDGDLRRVRRTRGLRRRARLAVPGIGR